MVVCNSPVGKKPRSPAAFFEDSIFSPPLLPRMLAKPLMVCFCQLVTAAISASVAPFARFIIAMTSAFLFVRSAAGLPASFLVGLAFLVAFAFFAGFAPLVAFLGFASGSLGGALPACGLSASVVIVDMWFSPLPPSAWRSSHSSLRCQKHAREICGD